MSKYRRYQINRDGFSGSVQVRKDVLSRIQHAGRNEEFDIALIDVLRLLERGGDEPMPPRRRIRLNLLPIRGLPPKLYLWISEMYPPRVDTFFERVLVDSMLPATGSFFVSKRLAHELQEEHRYDDFEAEAARAFDELKQRGREVNEVEFELEGAETVPSRYIIRRQKETGAYLIKC